MLSLFCSICFLLLGTNLSWGQQVIGSFPYMDGGFEGQTPTTTLSSTVSTSAWTVSSTGNSSTRSIINDASAARTGNKYANHVTTSTTVRLQSPSTVTQGTGPAVSTQYTVQYYFKTATDPTTGLNAGGIYNDGSNSRMAASTIVGAWSSTTWTKAYSTITTNATQITPYAATGFGAVRTAIASSNLYDDFVIYPGAYDSTGPTVVSTPTVAIASATTFNVGWTASADSDKSGYMVVRYSANPSSNALAIPNLNGIYAVGNTITNGSATGTVVHIGPTATTSFTDTVADTGVVYYYRIFTVDKAFNYSSPVDVASLVDNTPPPSAGTVSIGGFTANSLAVSWEAAASIDGGGYMVVRYTSNPNADNDPTQKTTYAATNTYTNGTGSLTGTVLYVGTGLTVTDTGLSELTTYYYKVYTFDQAKNYSDESTANGTTVSSVVVDDTPPNNPGAVTISNQTASTLTTSWVAAVGGVDGGGYLVLRFSGVPDADADPTQKQAYLTGENIFNLGSTNPKTAKVAYVGTNLTFVNTALNEGNNYYFKVYTFDQAKNYSGEATVTGKTATQIVAPVAIAADMPTATSFNANWVAVANATGYTVSVYTSTNTISNIVGWTIPAASTTDGPTLLADVTSTNNTTNTLSQNAGGTVVTTVSGNPTNAARGATYYSMILISGTEGVDAVYAPTKTTPDKYWQIEVNTVGYKNATISSHQYSTNTGPRDWKLQYSSTGPLGTFTDLVSTITLGSAVWNTTAVNNVALPASCQNNPSVVLRWMQTTFTNTNGVAMTTPSTGGTSRIDNILVKGEKLDAVNTFSVTGDTTTSASITGLTGGNYYYDVFATGTNTTSGSGVVTKYITSQKSNVISYWLAIPESIADFKSVASGNLNDPTVWQYYDGSAWIAAANAPINTNNVTITAGHEIALTANFSIASTKTMTVNGTINLAGYKLTGSGTFTLTSANTATIKLGDNVSLAAGVITTNKTFGAAANYVFNGTISQYFTSLPTPITGNITVDNSAGVYLVASTAINSPGIFTVTTGSKLWFGDGLTTDANVPGRGTFNITGSGFFTANDGCTLVVTGSRGLSNNTGNLGLIETKVVFGNNINYWFYKNDGYTVMQMGDYFVSKITSINNLVVNNPMGVYLGCVSQAKNVLNTANNMLTEFSPITDITVNGTLHFMSGKLIANNGSLKLNTDGTLFTWQATVNGVTTTQVISSPQTSGTASVIIGASGSITGAGSDTGWVIGNLKKLTNSGASPSFSYAIGDANYYTPLALTFTGNTSATGGLTARTTAGDHPQLSSSDLSPTISVNRTWTLTNASLAGFTNYNATFAYPTQDNDSSVLTQFYASRLYNGSSWATLTNSGTPTSTNLTASSISGFGDFAVGAVTSLTTTKIKDAFCGSTLPAMNTQIKAEIYPAAQLYRYHVSRNGTLLGTYEVNKSNFDFMKIPGILYGLTYSIKVAVKIDNIWGGYGTSCNVTTPTIVSANNVPLTSMRASQCGTTLAKIGSPIHSELVYAAEAYRFQLTNGSTVTEIESPIYYFFLTDTAIGTYGTTFSVKTKVKIAGIWGNYGSPCSISTPTLSASSVPTTQVRPSFCETTLATLSTKIPAVIAYNAEGYRFEITNGATVVVYDSALYNFRLSDAGIVATSGTTYGIRVAAKVNGVYGNYGLSCNVTTPGIASNSRTIIENTDFNLVAYPNPSNSTFKLQVNGSNEDEVSILVFDMMGRQIENKVVKSNDIENITLGQNYSTGVYNVIVSQGMNTKTVRLVKK